ncbi:MAG: hypothetical protein FJZ01_17965 [Candidatus Sericytochromatia bacterium]|nr:hypothetical protein [Candidatus Tanganyikabacteria bacterium]
MTTILKQRTGTPAPRRPFSEAAAKAWTALRSALGTNPPERARQLAVDAVLMQILIDRGLIDTVQAASAAQDRDRSGLLIEHVLHARYGVALDALLEALAERRAIMAGEVSTAPTIPGQLTA